MIDIFAEVVDRSVTTPLLVAVGLSTLIVLSKGLLIPVSRIDVDQEPDHDLAGVTPWRLQSVAYGVAHFTLAVPVLYLLGATMLAHLLGALYGASWEETTVDVATVFATRGAPYLLGFTVLVVLCSLVNRALGGSREIAGCVQLVSLDPGFRDRHGLTGAGFTVTLVGREAREELSRMDPVPTWFDSRPV